MKRVLLLLSITGYRNDDFLAAAKKLGRSLARGGYRCLDAGLRRQDGTLYCTLFNGTAA
ncbi:MAG: hypothetical protein AABM64_07265 [Pseudomonadota bacterium]